MNTVSVFSPRQVGWKLPSLKTATRAMFSRTVHHMNARLTLRSFGSQVTSFIPSTQFITNYKRERKENELTIQTQERLYKHAVL
jgi:hypothetical protein